MVEDKNYIPDNSDENNKDVTSENTNQNLNELFSESDITNEKKLFDDINSNEASYPFNSDDFSEDEDNSDSVKNNKKRKKKNKKSKYSGPIIFVTIIVLFSLLLAGGIIFSASDVMGMNKSNEIVEISIPKGASNELISNILKDKKIIKIPLLFRFIAKNEDEPFNYGEFTMSPGMSYSEIFQILQEKTDVAGVYNFTIIEGDTLYTVAKKLAKKNICTVKGFANLANNAKFGYKFEKYITENSLKFNKVEGYLFPDTYRFHKGQTTEEMVKKIFGNFELKITDEMYNRMNQLGLTLEETITLASIIQAEAPDKNQMKMVSSVFHNRLKNSSAYPRLESDPTRKYVDNNIKPYSEEENKAMNDAYNTYVGKGLPPGPICNPGIDAINATLYPETSDYLYFCSNIKTKKCYFAKTLAQHGANLVKAGLR